MRSSLILNTAALLFADSSSALQTAKTYPGDARYPTQKQWDLFNKTIDGNLIKAALPAAACYPPISNAAACSAAASLGGNEARVPSDPVLVQNPWWSGYGCLATLPTNSTNSTCKLGDYPSYVVAAKTAQHVSAGVRFASHYNLRLSVKNTGHDYLGRNLGAGGLSIWTYGFQGIDFTDDWVPSILPGQKPRSNGSQTGVGAVTYGAATMFSQLFDAVANRSVTITTGADRTVGAGGGWIQSGGHGYLANLYGMGVDNVLEHEVVTPIGDIVVANANINPDLFYALRGGGGSTFGITTRTTVKTHPKPTYGAASINISPGNLTSATFADAMAYFLSASGNFTDFGLTGYPIFSPVSYTGTFVAPFKTNAEVQTFLAPLVAGMKSRGATITANPANITDIAQVSVGYDSDAAGSTAINNVIFGSRLLTREGLDNTTAMSTALQTLFAKGYVILPYPNLGGQVAKNADLDVALNPAWRQATMHFIYLNYATPAASSTSIPAIEEAHRNILTDINPLVDPLSANSGAYLNEANYLEPDPQTTFWGGKERYAKLVAIKKKYDPKNTLWCKPCVGMEAFTLGEDGRLYLP